MNRRLVLLATLILLTLVFGGTSSAMAQNEPVGGCPDGFELHPAMDHDEHGDHLHAGTHGDANADGWLCMKHVSVDGHVHVHTDNNVPLP